MSSEGVQLKVIAHQGVQPIEAPPHVARTQTQVHAHAGRQVDHPRTVSSTIRNVAASTSLPIRSRSPLGRTNSSVESRLAVAAGTVSNRANRTGVLFRNRFRQ
jgi:hypothetical protein